MSTFWMYGAPQRAELERLNINQFNSALDYITKFERLIDAFKRATGETLPAGMLRIAFMGALDPVRGASSRWTPLHSRSRCWFRCRLGCTGRSRFGLWLRFGSRSRCWL
jgi:hypothetical protein